MGVHSTLTISRETAVKALLRVLPGEVSNDILGRFMGAYLYKHLYNCRVIDTYPGDDDHVIESLK